MPIGAQNLGAATGPPIGPRLVDPRAAVAQGVAVPTGVPATGIPAVWLINELRAAEVSGFAQLHVGPCTLYGWTLVGRPAGPTQVALIDGRTLDDPIVAAFELGFSTFALDKGIPIQTGLYLAWGGAFAPAGALYFQ